MQLQLYEKNPCVDYLNVILFVLDFYNTSPLRKVSDFLFSIRKGRFKFLKNALKSVSYLLAY